MYGSRQHTYLDIIIMVGYFKAFICLAFIVISIIMHGYMYVCMIIKYNTYSELSTLFNPNPIGGGGGGLFQPPPVVFFAVHLDRLEFHVQTS